MIHLVDSISIQSKNHSVYQEVRDKLEPVLETITRRDPHYEGHIQRACFYALEFGGLQGLSEKELRQLYLGAFFHDVGKVFISTEIINKKGPLDAKERRIMMTHAEFGESICKDLGPFDEIAELVGAHHERPNGTGYPKGLSGNEISYLSRILAIIEIYDALRSERSYKKPFTVEQSFDILTQNATEGNLDSNIVQEFAKFAQKIKVTPEFELTDRLKRRKI